MGWPSWYICRVCTAHDGVIVQAWCHHGAQRCVGILPLIVCQDPPHETSTKDSDSEEEEAQVAEFVASVTAAMEAIGQTVTTEALQEALAERERHRAARRLQRRPQTFGPQTGGSNMQVGPYAKKNKMKKEKKERRAKEREKGEVVEEMRKAHRTANEKLLAELRLITAAAARLQ